MENIDFRIDNLEDLEEKFDEILVESTANSGLELVLKGVDLKEVSDLFSALLNVFKILIFLEEVENIEEEWQENVEETMKFVLNDLQGNKLSEKQLEKNMQKMRKEIGTLSDNGALRYKDEILRIEYIIYGFMKMFNCTAEDAQFLITGVCNRLYGYIHNESYDLFTGTNKMLYILLENLEGICNPYIRDEVKEVVTDSVKLDHSQDKKLFVPMIKCLQKIYKNIEYYQKINGPNGYIEHLDKRSKEILKYYSLSAYTKETLNKN